MITSTYLEIASVKQEPEIDCFRAVSFNINAQLFVRKLARRTNTRAIRSVVLEREWTAAN